jgi:hypothetical protein
MTGADIVAALLRADNAVLAVAPLERIKLGRLPDGVTLTAMLVRRISSVDQQPLRWSKGVRITDRVSVTIRAASYRDQVAAIRLVRACCAGRTGDIGGGKAVSILTAGISPDVAGPADSFEQTCDFKVSFVEPA